MCTPMPFLFMKYGPYLRRKSRYAPSVPLCPPVSGAVAATGVTVTETGASDLKDREKVMQDLSSDPVELADARGRLRPGEDAV